MTNQPAIVPNATYADLVEAMRRNRIHTPRNDWTPLTREQLDLLGTPYYDLGGMFVQGHPEEATSDVWSDYVAEVSERNWGADLVIAEPMAIGFLYRTGAGRVVRIVIPTVIAAMLAMNAKLVRHIQVYACVDGRWILASSDNKMEQAIGISCLMVRDAELNVEIVEGEPRLDTVNAGRARARLALVGRTRVIRVNHLRTQYAGGFRRPHQGGTHARPREHVRVLTERLITPNGRKPYVRKANVITINPGVCRETKVVL